MAAGRPELCVGAVVLDRNRLLLIQRGRGPGRGLWSVPGGRVESGETLSRAVEREVLEETGLPVTCGPLVGWVERIGDDDHYVIMDFRASLEASAEPSAAVAGDDAAAVAWVPLDEVAEHDLVPGLAEFLVEHGVLIR